MKIPPGTLIQFPPGYRIPEGKIMTCDCDFCSMTRPDFCGPTIWQQLAGLGLSAIAGLLLLAWLVILPALGVIWIASRV